MSLDRKKDIYAEEEVYIDWPCLIEAFGFEWRDHSCYGHFYVSKYDFNEFGDVGIFYLDKYGEWQLSCSNGWFETKKAALKVMKKAGINDYQWSFEPAEIRPLDDPFLLEGIL